MFNVIIIGGEDCNNYDFFASKVISLVKNKAKDEGITVYTIGDDFVDRFTTTFHIDKKMFPTEWSVYGSDALKERNKKLIENADAIIYFNTNKKDLNIIYEMSKSKNIMCRKINIDY